MKLLRNHIALSSALLAVSAVFIIYTGARAESEPFPVYSCIQPNVIFWTKIYTEYSSNHGVIHDKRNLDIIYGVIELKNPDEPGAGRINRDRIRKAKNKYKMILAKLMRVESPLGPEEQQVATLFGPDAKPADYRSAMRNIRCQVGQNDRFREGIIRSGAYIEEIKQIFREHGLPEELSYLPHVESSFNPKAYSKFGAAGIWQFTRSTGRRYMRVDYTVDERRDPILSSHAAAKLLKNNYLKFKNWPMAITAYNHGTPGMLRAQRSKGNYESIFKSYKSRIFKFASRNFYSEFLAAREAAKYYRFYFGDLGLDAPQNSTVAVLKGYVSMPELAHQLKLDLAILSRLNPALREPVIRGQKYLPAGYGLRLPADSDQNWENLIAGFSPRLYKNAQKRSHIYTVRRGDTAGEIARIHGVKLQDLMAANNLDARATIYVNQNLRIPLPDDKSVALAKLQRPTKMEPNLEESSRLDPNADQPFTAPADSHAAEEEPPVLAGLQSDLVAEHEQIESHAPKLLPKMPQPTTLSGTDAEAAQPEADTPAVHPEILQGNFAVERIWHDQDTSIGLIRVEAEETLGHYAEWLDVSAWEIRQLNGFSYGRAIHLDQQIKIPFHRVSREEFEEKRFEYHKELSEDFFASYRIEKVTAYYIKRGDNIWTLSRDEFEVPLWLIRRYNSHLDFNMLIPSQKLLIPVVEKISSSGWPIFSVFPV